MRNNLTVAGVLLCCWLTFGGFSCNKGNEPVPPPSAPILEDPGAVSSTGNYTVEWSESKGATSYTLQEDDNSSFPSPTKHTGSSTLRGFSGKSNDQYYYRVSASNDHGSSPWSNIESITVSVAEAISRPGAPSGPTSGVVGQSLSYCASSATSNLGHPVQYQYLWGDGTVSDWSASACASHSYSSPGVKDISVDARCATHTFTYSDRSSISKVTIADTIHSVTRPTFVSGPSAGYINTPYLFSTGGATCNKGHAMEYFFAWGVGPASPWSTATSVQHSWNLEGSYEVHTWARCSVDPTLEAGISTSSLTIAITDPLCTIEITSPTADSDWTDGEVAIIRWDKTQACGPTVALELLQAGNYRCTIFTATNNDGFEQWTVDNCGGGYAGNYQIRIRDLSTGVESVTDQFWLTTHQCLISLTAPQSGVSWPEGQLRTITWNTGNVTYCGPVDLELYNSGAKVCTIASATPNDGSYAWTVSDCGTYPLDQDAYRVKLSSPATGAEHFSANFSIAPLDTFTIADVWWTDTVDNDDDGYRSRADLHIDVNVTTGTHSIHAVVEFRPYGTTTYFEYREIPPFTITGSSSADEISVRIGAGYDDLGPGLFDFRVHIFPNTAYWSPLVTADRTTNDELGAEAFEPGGDD